MSKDSNGICIIAAVNNRDILHACLSRSPDIEQNRVPLIVVENARSIAQAYNEGMSRTNAELCIFVHQDVYLPKGWLDQLKETLNALTEHDPKWQVAGPYGVQSDGRHTGRVWDVTMGRELGEKGFGFQPVVSFDELVLIVRRDTAFQFDPALPDFHLYGTDVVQNALATGRTAYAVELPVVHNNRPIATLRGGYARAYAYVRRKWARNLPIHTSICAVTWNPFVLWRTQWRRRHVKRRPPQLLADARDIAIAAGYE